jgi:dTDP-4-dehydrorhamnose 3,5-epimerase
MQIHETPLKGVLVLEPKIFRDDRGFFIETYSTRSMVGTGIPLMFVQDNHSRSSQNVLRGLHYQLERPQGKLVHAARGRIFDVAVDVRIGSPTFGKWFGLELNDENLLSLWIPPGFAHGFCVLSDFADVVYKCTALYEAGDDRGVKWDDAKIGIDWPIQNPIVSERDSKHEGLSTRRIDLPPYR